MATFRERVSSLMSKIKESRSAGAINSHGEQNRSRLPKSLARGTLAIDWSIYDRLKKTMTEGVK
jgi:hypothetical protein